MIRVWCSRISRCRSPMVATACPTSQCYAISRTCSARSRRTRRCGGFSTRSIVRDSATSRAARADARAWAWAAGAAPEEIVIDLDGTLLDAHSDKQDAAATYKHGFGFYPIVAYLDESGEALAGLLRAGNAGSNNAADHLETLDRSLAQLPGHTGRRCDAGPHRLGRRDP